MLYKNILISKNQEIFYITMLLYKDRSPEIRLKILGKYILLTYYKNKNI